MGNKQSEQAKDFELQINHPRLLKSKIITKDNQKLLQSSQSIDEKEYDKWKNALLKYGNTRPPHLLLPTDHSFSRAGLCGNTGILVITYESYPFLLVEQIYSRKGLKGKFLETELWFLLFCLVEGRKEAQTVGERLGDVRPENIFLNEHANIKIANSLSWPLELTNIQKSYDKTLTYLAPEDLFRISKGETFDAPSNVSEAFSIGLTVLSAGNLAKYENLYDLTANQLNESALNDALRTWAQNTAYSQVLRGVVLLLLSLNPEKRLTCSQLDELLNKHADHIVKKENFVVDNAPQKLHDQITNLRALLSQSILIQGAPSPLLTSEYKLDVRRGNDAAEERK